MSDVTETPAAPAGPPQHPPLPLGRALAYMAASVMLAMSQGLGQGFVSANIPAFAGDLGITVTQASWLMAAYMIPRASLPLMLIKLRTQFGLRRFAEFGIIVYVLVAFGSVWVSDFRSALVMQVMSGAAAAPLSTLAFLYMLEPLSPQWKMRLGLPIAMAVLMTGPTVARVISPVLIGDGTMTWVHLTALGMAMVSLALVYLLPLRPVPHMKVIERIDFLSFVLLAFGFAGLTIGFIMGPIHYWRDAAWIGWLLAGSVAALAGTVMIELNRKNPIIDIRWLVSPAMLHLTATLFLFRLILSEQSAGAPRMFQVLGVDPSQMTTIFAIIVAASMLGGLACVAWMQATRVPQFHLIALILIMAGAYMDSMATVLTRPDQMLISQSLIAFASMLFMPPAMMAGLIAALARGPQYLLSFVIVFISTQSLGGVLGSGLFTTFINHRQAAHMAVLSEQLTATDPQAVGVLSAQTAAYTGAIGDSVIARAQAMSQMAQQVTQQATVLAYNDAYFLIFLIAGFAAMALLLHLFRDWLAVRLAKPLPAGAEIVSET